MKDLVTMKIFFDVGANYGTSSLHIAKEEPDTVVYAFEPTPFLINHLLEESKELDNYIVIPKAVSNYNGNSILNIAGVEDWGCSSLLEFSSKTNFWGNRNFTVTERLQVDVIKLSDFIISEGIEKIDYFHCDAQGSDLNVLEGLEKYISIIEEGMIEAAQIEDILYVNQNRVDECINYLLAYDFHVYEIESDNYNFECNIKFRKK